MPPRRTAQDFDPGASVSLTAQAIDGTPTAQRINAGRNGFALPY